MRMLATLTSAVLHLFHSATAQMIIVAGAAMVLLARTRLKQNGQTARALVKWRARVRISEVKYHAGSRPSSHPPKKRGSSTAHRGGSQRLLSRLLRGLRRW